MNQFRLRIRAERGRCLTHTFAKSWRLRKNSAWRNRKRKARELRQRIGIGRKVDLRQ